MTDKIPDALAALDRACEYVNSEIIPLRKVFAIFAELIAADNEYDVARQVNDNLSDGVSTIGQVLNSDRCLDRAIERRKTALAAVEELK